MRSLERVNIRTNVRTYVLTYIRTGQTLYPLHNFVVRGDNNDSSSIYKMQPTMIEFMGERLTSSDCPFFLQHFIHIMTMGARL